MNLHLMYKEDILRNYEKLSFLEQIKVHFALEELVGKKETYTSTANHIKFISDKLGIKQDVVKKNTFYLEDLIYTTYGDAFKRMHEARISKEQKYTKYTFRHNTLIKSNNHRYEWAIIFNVLTEKMYDIDKIGAILTDIIKRIMSQDYFTYTLYELVKKYKQELITVEDKLFSYSISLDDIKYIQLDLYVNDQLYYYASIGEK